MIVTGDLDGYFAVRTIVDAKCLQRRDELHRDSDQQKAGPFRLGELQVQQTGKLLLTSIVFLHGYERLSPHISITYPVHSYVPKHLLMEDRSSLVQEVCQTSLDQCRRGT